MKKLPSQFIYPILIVMLLDFTFTMYGQPAAYWRNYTQVNEGSPLGFNLLSQNPVFFVIFFLLYLAGTYILLRFLPLFLSLILGISLFLGHAWGSSSWVPYLLLKSGVSNFQYLQWYSIIGYFIFISIVTTLLIYGYFKHPSKFDK